jgi:hypothetical protein
VRIGGGSYLANGIVRPFAGGGVQYVHSAIFDTQGQISDLTIPVDMGRSSHSLGAYFKGGVEVNAGAGIVVRANVFAGSRKIATGDQQTTTVFKLGINLSVGWQF